MNETKTSGLNTLQFAYDGATRTFSEIAAGTVDGISLTNGIISLDNPGDFAIGGEGELGVTITPSDSDGNTRVLSAPRIIVSHNEEGVINISQSRPIITSSTAFTNSNNNVRSNVEYRDIGIKLTVTPLIGVDGTVQMTIEQTIENIADFVTIDTNDQPVIGKREATSTVSVQDGQIVILGGLQENEKTENSSYFPIIGRWPIVRNFFGTDRDRFNKTEIIIFIRPKVLTNPAQAGEFATEYIENASRMEAVQEYLKTGNTGDIYMEGSKFEAESKDEEPKQQQKPEKKKETTPKTLEMPASEVKETVEITEGFSKAAALELEKEMPETIKTPEATKEVEALEEVIEAEVSETQQTATEVTAEVDAKSEETIVEKTEITESKKEMKRRERQEKKKLKKLQKLQRKKETEVIEESAIEEPVTEEPVTEEPVIEEPVVEELVIAEPVLTD